MRTPRALVPLLTLSLLAGCSQEREPGVPPDNTPPRATPAPPAHEVFRLEPDGAGGLRLSGVVATPEARSLLLAEVRRRWPGQPVGGDLAIEPGSPALWVPEAMALMPYAAAVAEGGLIVRAHAGVSGGGVLSITGRVEDDASLARIAADAEASVAPPFVVEASLDVGYADDATAVAELPQSRPVVVAGDVGAEDAAAHARSALGDASIEFQPGTAHLDPGAVDAIARLAAAVAPHPGIRVEVLASGEGTGSSSLDRALAARRAEAVVVALRSRGVDAGRLVASSEPSPGGTVTFRLSEATSD